jgi:nucleoside triphosphate pyrophosphatase
MDPVLVLASGSPRRAGILRSLGVPFRVAVSGVDESLRPGEGASEAAERLAREKAAAVSASESLPVLAADTVVVLGTQILGKPESKADAARMLRALGGRTHEVVTGVCLVAAGATRSAVDRTRVTFVRLTDEAIDWYVATGEPFDKAGGYHIDGSGAALIQGVEGSPSNVAGLPVQVVLRLARESGLVLGPP